VNNEIGYSRSCSGWKQAEFDAANVNFTGRIPVDNYKMVDGYAFPDTL